MKQTGVRLSTAVVLAACATASVPGSTTPSFGSIEGTVTDSVRRVPLSGAYVELRPLRRQTAVDARGHFRFDSVPAGPQYTIAAVHPLLDTLGIAVSSPEFRIGVSDTRVMNLAVPPAARIVTTLCATDSASGGTSAVTGFVRYLDNGAPVDSAVVTLTFSDSSMTYTDIPDAAGRFHFCGLPGRMNGRLQLIRKGVRTEWIPVSTSPGAPLARRALGVPLKLVKPPA